MYIANASFEGNDEFDIYLVNSKKIAVENCRFKGGCTSIEAEYCSDMRFMNCYLGCSYGLGFFQCSDIVVKGCTMNTTNECISMFNCSNSRFWFNNFYNQKFSLKSNQNITLVSENPVVYEFRNRTFCSYLGNYWSGYPAVDIDLDGIVDEPAMTPLGEELYLLSKPIENYGLKYVKPVEVTAVYELKNGWNLISVTVKALDYSNLTKYTMFTWDPEAGQYVVVVDSREVTPGKGYWIYVPEDTTIELRGVPVTDVYVKLCKGWNLIGSLYGTKAFCGVPERYPPYVISEVVITWDPKNMRYTPSTDIEPGRGYWVLCYVDEVGVMIAPQPPPPPSSS